MKEAIKVLEERYYYYLKGIDELPPSDTRIKKHKKTLCSINRAIEKLQDKSLKFELAWLEELKTQYRDKIKGIEETPKVMEEAKDIAMIMLKERYKKEDERTIEINESLCKNEMSSEEYSRIYKEIVSNQINLEKSIKKLGGLI